jgi:hypothetical protein
MHPRTRLCLPREMAAGQATHVNSTPVRFAAIIASRFGITTLPATALFAIARE